MALEPLASGDPAVVGGYRLRGRLGAGGMGVVYLAFTPGGRPVALKVVRPELGDDPDFRARFQQEVAAARRVSGFFTAQVVDADPDGRPPWLATAYVAGPSLQEAVTGHGPLPVQSVLLLVAGVAEALTAIHAAGVVHRDLKPSNVLLAADGPRVIDFGIARAAESTALTQTGKQIGSPQYMSPEQVRGEPVTPAADVWALGALACFAATGRPPFGDGPQAAVLYRVMHEAPDLNGLPGELPGILGACMSRDPAARPSPARVLEWCQPGAAGRTAEYTQDWLPAALAADLAGHAPPPVTPAYPAATLGGPATAQPPAAYPGAAYPGAAYPGAAVPGQPFAAYPGAPVPDQHAPTVPAGPAAYPMPGPTVPQSYSSMPGAGIPGQFPAAGPPGGPGRGRSSRALVAAVVAAVVVLGVLVGYAVTALHRSTTDHPPTAGQRGASQSASRGRSKGPSGGSTAPASSSSGSSGTGPSGAAVVDTCLVGTWNVTLQQVINTINGAPVEFSGDNGWTVTVQASGAASETWTNSVLTAEVDGNDWEEIINGTATYDVKSVGTQLVFSNESASGTLELLENGSYNSGDPLTIVSASATYSCSGNVLRETQPTDVSAFIRAG
jgi:serine/threonine kinase PknH